VSCKLSSKRSDWEKTVAVSPILDCLCSEESLHAELKGEDTKTVAAILKEKSKVMGKRPNSKEKIMEEGNQSFVLRSRDMMADGAVGEP
jgi:hypothetical protein